MSNLQLKKDSNKNIYCNCFNELKETLNAKQIKEFKYCPICGVPTTWGIKMASSTSIYEMELDVKSVDVKDNETRFEYIVSKAIKDIDDMFFFKGNQILDLAKKVNITFFDSTLIQHSEGIALAEKSHGEIRSIFTFECYDALKEGTFSDFFSDRVNICLEQEFVCFSSHGVYEQNSFILSLIAKRINELFYDQSIKIEDFINPEELDEIRKKRYSSLSQSK